MILGGWFVCMTGAASAHGLSIKETGQQVELQHLRLKSAGFSQTESDRQANNVEPLKGRPAPATAAESEEWSNSDEWQDDEWQDDEWGDAENENELTWRPQIVFAELGLGQRFTSDDTRDSLYVLQELRAQVEWQYDADWLTIKTTTDFVANGVVDSLQVDVRELVFQAAIGEQTDVRVGRQIMSWGVGDYVFLNDLFPKNWQAFFNGRDDEYLKAAANAVQLSHYFEQGNIQLVWFPRFTPDDFINGQYFSYFNSLINEQSSNRVLAQRSHDSEVALRIFKRFDTLEIGLYGHWGKEKTPRSIQVASGGEAYFSTMHTYGASISSPVLGGLLKAEVSYSTSKEDERGTNPLISNSVFKALIGYDTELFPKLTGSWQAYIEAEQDYAEMQQTWPDTMRLSSRHRVMFTQLYRYQLWQDTLTLNLLHMHSTSDKDGYVRFSAAYRYSDQWQITLGSNVFYGNFQDSFFGQFTEGSNAYLRVRHYW